MLRNQYVKVFDSRQTVCQHKSKQRYVRQIIIFHLFNKLFLCGTLVCTFLVNWFAVRRSVLLNRDVGLRCVLKHRRDGDGGWGGVGVRGWIPFSEALEYWKYFHVVTPSQSVWWRLFQPAMYVMWRWKLLPQCPVLLTFLRHVARISANGIAAFKESCAPIG